MKENEVTRRKDFIRRISKSSTDEAYNSSGQLPGPTLNHGDRGESGALNGLLPLQFGMHPPPEIR